MEVTVRRFDPVRDAQSFRECLIDQQNFHRAIEPSWPEGEAIVDTYVTYLETECADHNGCILMADCDGQAAGFICVVAATHGDSPEDPAPFAWVHELYVKPEHRRLGVGTMLMAEAENFARDQGAKRLRLGVLDKNDGARGLYATHGYREHARVLTKSL